MPCDVHSFVDCFGAVLARELVEPGLGSGATSMQAMLPPICAIALLIARPIPRAPPVTTIDRSAMLNLSETLSSPSLAKLAVQEKVLVAHERLRVLGIATEETCFDLGDVVNVVRRALTNAAIVRVSLKMRTS